MLGADEADPRHGAYDFYHELENAPQDLQQLTDQHESMAFRRRGYERVSWAVLWNGTGPDSYDYMPRALPFPPPTKPAGRPLNSSDQARRVHRFKENAGRWAGGEAAPCQAAR